MSITPIENDAYSVKHRKVDVEIGDPKAAGFKPRFKLKRWDGECSLNIDFTPAVLEEEEVEEKIDAEGNITKIKYKAKADGYEIEFEYYPIEPRIESLTVNGEVHDFLQNELGGFEWEFILKQMPPNLVWKFPIQTEGLRFLYQPPLHPNHPTWADTNEDGIPDIFCPENVVGSYAVYHATRTNVHALAEDAEKYKCGKVGHFYYPYLIDADGWKIRVEDFKIDIEKGLLSITLPHEFMDKAVYPVVVDPNFGYEEVGAANIGVVDRIIGSWFTCPESGTADSITANFYQGWNSFGYAKCAIYKKSDNSFVGNTEELNGVQNSFRNTWRTFNFSAPKPSLLNIDYWLVAWASTGSNISINMDADVAGKRGHEVHDYNDFPGSWNPALEAWICSIYCTYTAGAPPAGQPYISRVQRIPGMKTWPVMT